MVKEEEPEKNCPDGEKPSIPDRGRSTSPVSRRLCRGCLYHQIWGNEVSYHVADAIRRHLLLEIRRMLTSTRETRREASRSPTRPRHVVTAWRCEETQGGGWTARVCRDLFGMGRTHTQSCKQHHCSKMKERLEKHHMNCQAASKVPVKPRQEKSINKIDQASSTSTKASVKVSTSRQTSPLKRNSKIQTAQTNIGLTDNQSPERGTQFNRIDKEQNCLKDGIRLKASPTREILPKRNLYRERLNSEIQEFFYDIPVFPNTSEKVKQKRLNIIRNFVDKIADLFVYTNNKDYYDKVRDEVENCLRNLPMWEPEADSDKAGFKKCLCDSLFKFIKTFNEQWYSFRKKSQATEKIPNSFVAYNDHVNHIFENVITYWVDYNLKTDGNTEMVIDTLIKKIQPILESGAKHVSKEELLNIFEELSPHLHLSINKELQLNMFASDLANILNTSFDKDDPCDDSDYKKRMGFEDDDSIEILKDCKLMSHLEDNTVNQITDILFSNIDSVLQENSFAVIKDVSCVLKSTGEFSDSEAANLAKTLVMDVRDCFNEDFYVKLGNPNRSSSFFILTSEQEMSQDSGPKFHSTPRKEIPALNKAEKHFTEKVSEIVNKWLDSTDVNFKTKEGHIYKETIITDMVNDIRSTVKRTIQSGGKIDGNSLKQDIMRSIRRFELISNTVTEKSPQVVDLWEHIMALDTSSLKTSLLEPEHGNKQAMANVKFADINEYSKRNENYQPKSLDILEDNISVWMNEQPSDIFEASDKATRNKLLHEIATKVHEKLVAKKPEEEVNNEIRQWLKKILIPKMRRNIDGLAEILKNIIIKLPQDDTLSKTHQKRIYTSMNTEQSVKYSNPNQNTEADVKLNEFVEKFIQRNYNVDDNIVKGVLTLMLKQELLKMSPPIREDLYKNNTSDEFNKDKFHTELDIIIEIYDWLRRICFYYPLLKSESERINFIHGLARNITDIERERVNNPSRVDYNSWLHSEIAVYLLKKEEEVNEKDLPKIDYHANELLVRIIKIRKDCGEGELNKIIAEYMKKHDDLLAKDYLKKVMWHKRLGEEVMKMLVHNPAATRADVENTLASVPVPRDESVSKFKMEIKYNIAVQDWLHALPLIPPKDNEEALRRKNMIDELLQEIIKAEERKAILCDNQAEKELDRYTVKWISRLNFNPTVKVDVLTLVSQLKGGIEYVKSTEKQTQQTSHPNLHGTIDRTNHSQAHGSKLKDPGEQIVEAIESWCNNLPIEADAESAKAIKEQVATNMFQKVGYLSGDLSISNNKQNFLDSIANEIEVQLQNLSEHNAVTENKDILKAELLEKIVEAKDTVRDVNDGDNYVQALEKSMDMSFSPLSGSSTKTNPGYELFKKRMVMRWLLENYDYAVDYHSLKYKKLLSDEINLLSAEGQDGDIFPEDKEEIMVELMSEFYNAKPPNEDAVVYEIEYIKLRCEIELWVKELPLKATCGYKKLLERDQILTILSKILFDIERNEEADADEKMHAEIMKWSKKLPLLAGETNNLTQYADLLICRLKATMNSRKCQRQSEPKNLSIVQETLKNLRSSDELNSIKDTVGVPKTHQGNISQVAGPSASRPCCSNECGPTKENLTYLITNAIENWSNQLPLQFNNPDEHNLVQRTKEQIIQRLMRLVSELHYRPNTLSNEGLYEYYLNNEIENILAQLANSRLYWEAQFERNERKSQLINALKAIRPLVQGEKEREGYKDKLKHTISSFHESMAPYSAVQVSEDTQMAILDDFLQYNNHKGDFESQELYKLKIKETLNEELNGQKTNIDPLIAANRLICEMSKVKLPTHSNAKQRRFSQPNPIGNTSRLPSAPTPRRHSLPYTSSQKSFTRFVPSNFLHQQSHTTFLDPVENPQPFPRSMPVAASSFYELPSDFEQGAMPVPAPRAIYQRMSDIQPSMPVPPPRVVPRIPLEMQSSMPFPAPRIISQSRPELQQESIAIPFPQPRTLVPQTNLEMRPFPMTLPTYNDTNTNYLPPRALLIQGPPEARPRFVEQQNPQADFDSAQPFRGPQGHVETGDPEVRTTARVRNTNSSRSECPEEQRLNGQRQPSRDYCETCERDRDCMYMRRPYPLPMDYMYY